MVESMLATGVRAGQDPDHAFATKERRGDADSHIGPNPFILSQGEYTCAGLDKPVPTTSPYNIEWR